MAPWFAEEAPVDSLDVRILRAYIQGQTFSPITAGFREPLAELARKLGQNEDVVRHRLQRIEASGFISDWRLFVNPNIWGGGTFQMRFEIEPDAPKADLVAKLRLVPNMTHVAVFYDSLVAIQEYEDEGLIRNQIELVRRLVGRREAGLMRDAFPECARTLTARDWDLIRALRRDPRRPYAELAAAVGLTPRTARARLSRLLSGGVAFAWPTFNMRVPLGGPPVFLEVRYPVGRKAAVDRAVASHAEPYHWHTLHMLPFREGDLWPCGYHLMVPNLSVAREIERWTRAFPGVAEARTYVYEDLINFSEEYDARLDRRLSRMPRASPASRPSEAR